MKLGFCLFKYFPYGGLQKDFLDVALQCQADGHQIVVYTMSWQGDIPAGFEIREIETHALTNHKKYQQYHHKMRQIRVADQLDCLIGFNKMPDLDVYFASDPCYKAKQHYLIQRLGARYRHFMRFEEAVCGLSSHTIILTLAPTQQTDYQQAWQIDESRFRLLPPGISRRAMADSQASGHRQRIRAEFGIKDDEFLLLMVGSGFRTKGLDRALHALASLPELLRSKTRLLVVGQDKADAFAKMVGNMGLSQQVSIMSGRDDIAALMQAGDCLIHPAYREVAGKVILEAVVAGLPVLVTDVCGYAHHVTLADCGYVLSTPFDQQALNEQLARILDDDEQRRRWRENGITYGKTENLYEMTSVAAQLIQGHCRKKSAEIA